MSRRRKQRRSDRKKKKQIKRVATSALAAILGIDGKEEDDDTSAQLRMPFPVPGRFGTVQELADAIKSISASVRLEVCRTANPYELTTSRMEMRTRKSKVVYFVPIDCVRKGLCQRIDNEIDESITASIGFFVVGCNLWPFVPFTWTSALLRSHLSPILEIPNENECVMCLEDLCTATKCVSPCRNPLYCNQCGACICSVCVVKIAVANRQLMHDHPCYSHSARFECPVCRFDHNVVSFPCECGEIVKNDFVHELDDCLHEEIFENAKLWRDYDSRKQPPTCCSFCSKPFASKRAAKGALACDKCKYNRYCSRRCRLKDKKQHTEMCRLWSLK